MPNPDEWLSRQAAAEYLTLSVRRVDELIVEYSWQTVKRKLPGHRQAAIMVRLADLEAHKNRPRKQPTDPLIDITEGNPRAIAKTLAHQMDQLLKVQFKLIECLDAARAAFERFAEKRDE